MSSMQDNEISLLKMKPFMIDLAQDLAMYHTPAMGGTSVALKDILETYDITESELKTLLQNNQFKTYLRQARDRINSLGDNAPEVLRFRGLALSLAERAYNMAMVETDLNKVAKVFGQMASFSMLDPNTNGQAKNDETAMPIGTTVNITIPTGIPGMEHLQSTQIVTPKVIEHE